METKKNHAIVLRVKRGQILLALFFYFFLRLFRCLPESRVMKSIKFSVPDALWYSQAWLAVAVCVCLFDLCVRAWGRVCICAFAVIHFCTSVLKAFPKLLSELSVCRLHRRHPTVISFISFRLSLCCPHAEEEEKKSSPLSRAALRNGWNRIKDRDVDGVWSLCRPLLPSEGQSRVRQSVYRLMSNFITPKIQSEVKARQEFSAVILFELPFYVIAMLLSRAVRLFFCFL